MLDTLRAGVSALALLTLVACSSGSEPGTLAYAGTYHASDAARYQASELLLTESGETIDLIAQGAVLEMSLTDDGRTSGRLFVPGAGEDGEDFDADLAGRWTLEGETVHFDHAADTFIRDVPFTLEGNLLSGEFTKGSTTVRATLVKE